MATLIQQVVTIVPTPGANGGNAGLYSALVTWLAAHPGIIIQDVDWYRPLSTFAAEYQRLRIAYVSSPGSSVGLIYQALFYQGSATLGDAQTQFNAAFGAGAVIVPDFILDVTEPNRTRLDEDTLLVIGPETGPSLVGDDRSVFVAQPLADILSLAAGASTLIGPDGSIVATGVLVTNVDPINTWPANQRNYAVVDEISGLYIGLPSCSTPDTAWSPPAATTTTAFPCAAVTPATTPVGFGQ